MSPAELSRDRDVETGTLRFSQSSSLPPTDWRENLRSVLPLVFLAAACFVLSYYLFQEAGSLHPTRIPLWLLSSSIGLVASVGATTAVLFGDFSETPESPAQHAWASGEYVLVPTAVWDAPWDERTPARAPPSANRGRKEAHRPVPAHARSPASSTPRAVLPAADRLAAQVDQLLSELSLETGSARPSSDDLQNESPSPWSEESARETGIPIVEGLTARAEYESLLRELTVQAQRLSTAPSMRCSGCGKLVGVTDAWEGCPRCERPFCPDCSERYHPPGSSFRCPRCPSDNRG